MHSFSNWAERRNKGLQMAQAVVSVYLIQISPSWWNLFQSMCLRQHVICILSIYTALPTRSTKKYKMDICWFFYYQVYISRFQTAPCLHFEELLLPDCRRLVRQKIQDAALTLRKTKGFLEAPPDRSLLSSSRGWACLAVFYCSATNSPNLRGLKQH